MNMTNRGRGRPSRRRGFDDDFAFDRAPPGDMPRAAPSWPSSAGFGPEHDATVKWFNPEKGFGFVALSDGSGALPSSHSASSHSTAGFEGVGQTSLVLLCPGEGSAPLPQTGSEPFAHENVPSPSLTGRDPSDLVADRSGEPRGR